jgi:hypothetical protein
MKNFLEDVKLKEIIGVIQLLKLCNMFRHTVNLVTCYIRSRLTHLVQQQAVGWIARVRFLAWARDLSFLHNV